MGLVDQLLAGSAPAGTESKSFNYFNKKEPFKGYGVLKEAKIKPSENPDYEGDDMLILVFGINADEVEETGAETKAILEGFAAEDMEAELSIVCNMSTAQPKKRLGAILGEVRHYVASLTGVPVSVLESNAKKFGEYLIKLTEDDGKANGFAGTRYVITTKERSGGWYRHCFEAVPEDL